MLNLSLRFFSKYKVESELNFIICAILMPRTGQTRPFEQITTHVTSTACNPHWHLWSRKSTISRVHRVTPYPIKHTQDCHGSTMSMSHSNTPPVRNRAPLIARSSSLRCVLAVEHQTAEQYSKTAGQNPESISHEAIYHGTLARTSSTYQVFEKLLQKPSEDASQRSSSNQMSFPI